MKITKKQYHDYCEMSSAVNHFNRVLADLHAHVEFLQRTQNVDALDALADCFGQYVYKVCTNYENTLTEDELEK